MASCSEEGRRHCWPRSTRSSAGWPRPKSGSTSPSACSRKGATLISSRGRTEGYGRHPGAHPHFRGRCVYRDGVLPDRPGGGRPNPRQERVGRRRRCAHTARGTEGGARPGPRGGAARGGGARGAHGLRRAPAGEESRKRAAGAAAPLMNPEVVAVLIPVVAVGGFFSWMIALAVSKASVAKLKVQTEARPAAGQEDVLAALEELRREVAELAERVDFTERLLAKGRDGEAGKPASGERRTGST